MKLADQLAKGLSGESIIGGRQLEQPDNSISVYGWSEGPVVTEPERSIPVGSVGSFCIPPSDLEAREANLVDIPREFIEHGLYGQRKD
jgi:hypothetical protein